MVLMGKPYSRYRTFNDAVSLTIFIAIDNAQFVKFITEVQDKNSKIMPLAEMMILRNLMDNRKEQLSIPFCIDNSYFFHTLFFVSHIFSTNPVPLLYCHYCV